jgi:DNA gyrase subunit A
VTERNGEVIGAVPADDNDEVMLISDGGTLVRTRVREISVMGRNTQGVRLIALANGEKLVGMERILEDKGEGEAAGVETGGEGDE